MFPHMIRPAARVRSPALAVTLALLLLCLPACHNAKRPGASRPSTAAETHLFRDAAAAAGIRFTHRTGAAGKFYYIEETGAGCAFVDYDNDGFLDVVLVQSGDMPRTPG